MEGIGPVVFSPILSPILQPKTSLASANGNTAVGYLVSDPALEVLRACNHVVDYLAGAQDYWSAKGLLAGYGEAAHLISHFVEESIAEAHPVAQATAGSAMGVAKILGAIPFGLGHWMHRTVRDTVDHDLGTGAKTLVAIPVEGMVEGGNYLLNQGNNWVQGNISQSTYGVADEITTTLGTAVLMVFGFKAIHRGGTGMINGLKNIEIPNPALATPTGHVLPLGYGIGAIKGSGAMTEGLVWMAGSKKDAQSELAPEPSSGKAKETQVIKDETEFWATHMEAFLLERSQPRGKARKPKAFIPATDGVISSAVEKAINRGKIDGPQGMLSFIENMCGSDPRVVVKAFELAKIEPNGAKLLEALRDPDFLEVTFREWTKYEVPDSIWARLMENISDSPTNTFPAISLSDTEALILSIETGLRPPRLNKPGIDIYLKKHEAFVELPVDTILAMTETPKLRADLLQFKVSADPSPIALQALKDLARKGDEYATAQLKNSL